MRPLAIAMLAATALSGQTVLQDARKIADAARLLDTASGASGHCDISPVWPRFVFSLRLQAGYRVDLPLPETEPRQWVVLARVTPKNGSPVYFSNVVSIPAAPAAGGQHRMAEVNGAFWLGEGHYSVKFLAFDANGHVCRKEWQMDARLSLDARQVPAAFAPSAIADIAVGGNRPATARPEIDRLTILMDVVPERRTADQIQVIDGLLALLDELPAHTVRLVMFDLTQQKEILRRDGFTSAALPEVVKAIDAVQFEPVNVRTLQNPAGAVDLVEHLADLEMHAAEPADTVVFLGTKATSVLKPSTAFGAQFAGRPRFFYVLCQSRILGRYQGNAGRYMAPPVWVGPGNGPTLNSGINGPAPWGNPNSGRDTIEYAVEQLRGKTLKVDSPESFAGAVAAIR